MDKTAIRDKLKVNPWFARLSDEHFEKMISIAKKVSWSAGKIIFREGDKDPHVYLLLKGHVAIEMYVPGRGRVTILTVGTGDLLGWSSLLTIVEIRTASARSIHDTDAIAFDAVALRELCDEEHELGYAIFRRVTNVVASRLTATRLQLLNMYALGTSGDD